MNEQEKRNGAEKTTPGGCGDIVSLLRAVPERECRDISGDVMAEIARRRNVRRWLVSSAVAAAAAAAVFLLALPEVFTGGDDGGGVSTGALASGEPELSAEQWLVSVQERDGTWNPAHWGGSREYIPAVTGFAMMSLARHDEAELDSSVADAAQALRAMQTAEGRFGATGDRMLFNHGIATVAMLRLYETGRFPELFTVIDGAVNHIRTTQTSSGGWADGENTQAGIWLVDALSRASRLGWQDKGGHLRRGIRWLENSSEPFAGDLASAQSLAEKRDRVEKLCSEWVSRNSFARAGGKVYAASVAAL